MAEPLDPNELVTIEDLALSSMGEVAALVVLDSLKRTARSSGYES